MGEPPWFLASLGRSRGLLRPGLRQTVTLRAPQQVSLWHSSGGAEVCPAVWGPSPFPCWGSGHSRFHLHVPAMTLTPVRGLGLTPGWGVCRG